MRPGKLYRTILTSFEVCKCEEVTGEPMHYADGAYNVIAPGTIFMFLGDYKEIPTEPNPREVGYGELSPLRIAGSIQCFWKILLDETPVWLFSSYRDKHMVIANIIQLDEHVP